MMGVFSNPSLSSSALMAATRPSIMSDGATTSAPASACEAAVRARSSRLTSFRTSPVSFSTTPQWPAVRRVLRSLCFGNAILLPSLSRVGGEEVLDRLDQPGDSVLLGLGVDPEAVPAGRLGGYGGDAEDPGLPGHAPPLPRAGR